MPKTMTLAGADPFGAAPQPNTAEDAAFEYFVNFRFAGAWAPRPPIHRWREDQRKRFLAELGRLEDERVRQAEDAARFAERLGQPGGVSS